MRDLIIRNLLLHRIFLIVDLIPHLPTYQNLLERLLYPFAKAHGVVVWENRRNYTNNIQSSNPISEISKFCKDKGILLIEDCAHAPFTKIDNQLVGSFGDASISEKHCKMISRKSDAKKSDKGMNKLSKMESTSMSNLSKNLLNLVI